MRYARLPESRARDPLVEKIEPDLHGDGVAILAFASSCTL
jgi:hypothetical protein